MYYRKSKKSMYYSTWVFVNLVAIFRIFEIVQNVPQVLPKSCEQFRQNPIFRFRLAVILKISMKIKEIHVLQYMGFCQFGCDFPNFRNLSKTFLRYSRKVVSSFVSQSETKEGVLTKLLTTFREYLRNVLDKFRKFGKSQPN